MWFGTAQCFFFGLNFCVYPNSIFTLLGEKTVTTEECQLKTVIIFLSNLCRIKYTLKIYICIYNVYTLNYFSEKPRYCTFTFLNFKSNFSFLNFKSKVLSCKTMDIKLLHLSISQIYWYRILLIYHSLHVAYRLITTNRLWISTLITWGRGLLYNGKCKPLPLILWMLECWCTYQWAANGLQRSKLNGKAFNSRSLTEASM